MLIFFRLYSFNYRSLTSELKDCQVICLRCLVLKSHRSYPTTSSSDLDKSFWVIHGSKLAEKRRKKNGFDTQNVRFSLKWKVSYNTSSHSFNTPFMFFPHFRIARKIFPHGSQDWTRSWATWSLKNQGCLGVGHGWWRRVLFKWFVGGLLRLKRWFQTFLFVMFIPKFGEMILVWWYLFFRWVVQPPTRRTIVTICCFHPWIWCVWPLITAPMILVWAVFFLRWVET